MGAGKRNTALHRQPLLGRGRADQPHVQMTHGRTKPADRLGPGKDFGAEEDLSATGEGGGGQGGRTPGVNDVGGAGAQISNGGYEIAIIPAASQRSRFNGKSRSQIPVKALLRPSSLKAGIGAEQMQDADHSGK